MWYLFIPNNSKKSWYSLCILNSFSQGFALLEAMTPMLSEINKGKKYLMKFLILSDEAAVRQHFHAIEALCININLLGIKNHNRR